MAQAPWDNMVIALQKEGHVHCKGCQKEVELRDALQGEWHRMGPLPWCSGPAPSAFWICPECATTESTTATAASASQLAPTTATTTDAAESAGEEVQQLKAEVVELKAEIERLTAEVVEPKDEDTKQTKKARLVHTIVVAFTEDEAKEMRNNAERTRELAESLLNLSSDMCGPCAPWSVEQIADQMQHDGNQIVTLSSRLLELFSRKGLLEHLSSFGV